MREFSSIIALCLALTSSCFTPVTESDAGRPPVKWIEISEPKNDHLMKSADHRSLVPVPNGMWIESQPSLYQHDGGVTASLDFDYNFPSVQVGEKRHIFSWQKGSNDIGSTCPPFNYVSYPAFPTRIVFDNLGTEVGPESLVWSLRPLSLGDSPGVITHVDTEGTHIAAAMYNHAPIGPDGGCVNVTKLALLSDSENTIFPVSIGYTSGLVFTQNQVHRIQIEGRPVNFDFAKEFIPEWVELQTFDIQSQTLRTRFRKGKMNECKIFTSEPLSVLCVSVDRKQLIKIDSTGTETVIKNAASDAGIRLIHIINPKTSSVAVISEATSRTQWGNIVDNEKGSLFVYRPSYLQPNLILKDILTHPVFSGDFGTNIIRLMLYQENSDSPRFADFEIDP